MASSLHWWLRTPREQKTIRRWARRLVEEREALERQKRTERQKWQVQVKIFRIVCSKCQGGGSLWHRAAGSLDWTRKTCPECGGTGKVVVT